MKKTLALLLGLVMAMGIAFAQDDMQVDMVKINKRKRNYKTKKVDVSHKNLAKILDLKVKSKKAKKSKKYKEVNDLFANVEYPEQKKAAPKDSYASELNELADLDRLEVYENKFEASEGKRAQKRRAKNNDLALSDATPFAAAPKKKMSKQLEGDLKPLSTYEFDTSPQINEVAQAEPKEEDHYIKKEKALTSAPLQYSSTKYSEPSSSSSWITLTAVGGYGSFNVSGTQDRLNMAGDYQNTQSYLGGVMADMGRGRFTLETGLLYMRIGIKRDVYQGSGMGMGMGMMPMMGAGPYTEFDDRDFVVAPIMGIYNFAEKTSSAIFAKAGIWPIYMTSATQTMSGMMMPQMSTDVSANFQKFDVLGSVGAGGRIRIGDNMAIVVEGYYLRGFQNTFNNPFMSGNSQGFLGNVGISFDL